MRCALLLFFAASSGAMVFTDNPDRHAVTLGTGSDGVVFLSTPSGSCTGALLRTGKDVLTAAHCMDDLANVPDVKPSDYIFKFIYLNDQSQRTVKDVAASGFDFAPGWKPDQNPALGNDLAVVHLAEAAPANVDRYDIYRSADEVGKVGKLFGYGQTGTGDTGEMPVNDIVDHFGQNILESHGDFLNLSPAVPLPLSANLLVYDFAGCNAAHDVYDFYFNKPDTLCVANEANTALGDSGGPTFLKGQIAGVHSFGFRMEDLNGVNTDVDGKINATYGEASADTEVSTRAGWIDSVIPEPGNFAPFAVAAAVLLLRARAIRTPAR